MSLFEIASRISTPLSLGGFSMAVLFFTFRQILRKNDSVLGNRIDSKVALVIVDRLFLLALVSMALGFVAFILQKQSPSSDSSQQQLQNQAGRDNIQAGRDVVIVNQANKQDAVLEVTNVELTGNREFDISVRNLGDTDLIIHKITITKTRFYPIAMNPILQPTAKYHLPVNDIPLGQSKSLGISHVVYANSADRFLVALDTTGYYDLKTTLEYNKGKTVSFCTTNMLTSVVCM